MCFISVGTIASTIDTTTTVVYYTSKNIIIIGKAVEPPCDNDISL